MKRLIIIGASGQGKVVADIAELNGYKEIVFLDDDEKIKECAGFPVVGKSSDATDGDVFIAVGNAQTRKALMQRYALKRQPVLIHPKAIVAESVKIGKGTVVMAGAVINPGAVIGEGCIINTASSVDHDCLVEDFVHVSVGAHLCGTVTVGPETWIGAGAVVSNNIKISGNCMIGAGSVVLKDINSPGTYVGTPAKRVKD